MALDKSLILFFENSVSYFDKSIKEVFHKDMIYISKNCNFENRGYFQLLYQYTPHNYIIKIENEYRAYSITIIDSENAWCYVKNFNNNLDEANIKESMLLLKKLLDQNDFTFYFQVDDKLYRKNIDGIKRIKHIEELLNE